MEEPWTFGFFQAVRLLERLGSDRAGVGGFDDPAEEVVRFSSNPDIAFPASEIQALDPAQGGPARMTVNFMGLVGPQGVLPLEYSQLVVERQRARDDSLRDFLDIFQHRMVSLFYRAWRKQQFGVAYEVDAEAALGRFISALVGFGATGATGFRADALPYYAGLLLPQQRSAIALEQLITDYFDVPAAIVQHVGAWHSVAVADQCSLDDQGDSSRLGIGAVAGDEVWDQQTRARVRIGPLSRQQYDDFLPGGAAHDALRELTRFFSHDQLEFELQLVLARDDVTGIVLGGAPAAAQPLGWTTWISTRTPSRDPDETILEL